MSKGKCGECGEEKTIVMKCHFCVEHQFCGDCAYEHRSWCMTKDDWEFIN